MASESSLPPGKLSDLLIGSFAGLVMAGVGSLDRVMQDGVQAPPPVLIFDRIGIRAYFSSLTRCSACFRCSLKSLRPVSSRLLSSPFCAAGISVDSSAPMTAS